MKIKLTIDNPNIVKDINPIIENTSDSVLNNKTDNPSSINKNSIENTKKSNSIKIDLRQTTEEKDVKQPVEKEKVNKPKKVKISSISKDLSTPPVETLKEESLETENPHQKERKQENSIKANKEKDFTLSLKEKTSNKEEKENNSIANTKTSNVVSVDSDNAKAVKKDNSEEIEAVFVPEENPEFSHILHFYNELKTLYHTPNEQLVENTTEDGQVLSCFSEHEVYSIKTAFQEIQESLSRIKKRHYEATFTGNWESFLTKDLLLKFIIKAGLEVNTRLNFNLIEEKEDSLFHFNNIEKKARENPPSKEKKSKSKSSKKTKINKKLNVEMKIEDYIIEDNHKEEVELEE